MATETLCDDVILAVAPRQVPILINIFIFGSKYRKKKLVNQIFRLLS